MERDMAQTHLKNGLSLCGIAQVGKTKGRALMIDFVSNYKIGASGYYQLFRKLVEFKQVCKAAELLFENIGKPIWGVRLGRPAGQAQPGTLKWVPKTQNCQGNVLWCCCMGAFLNKLYKNLLTFICYTLFDLKLDFNELL